MDATILPGPGAKARPPRARTDGERHSIQSVDRALFPPLKRSPEAGGEATLTDLSVRTGLNISTCHHLLATLIQRGFAAKVPGRRLYALGARILYLSHTCLQVDLAAPRPALHARPSTPRRAKRCISPLCRATASSHWRAVKQPMPCESTLAALARWIHRMQRRSARRSWPGCRKRKSSAWSRTA